MQLWDRHSICSPSLKMLLSIKTYQPKHYISTRTGTKQGYGFGDESHSLSFRIRIWIQVLKLPSNLPKQYEKKDPQNNLLSQFIIFFSGEENNLVSSSK
jgi:hypothetical protein